MNWKTNAVLATAMAACAAGAVPTASAGEHGDKLSACMQATLTADDRRMLTQWIFGALAAHPAVAHMSAVTEAQRKESDAAMARMFERLLTKDCRSEAVNVLRLEGTESFGNAFTALGEMAGRQIFEAPEVTTMAGRMVQQIDQKAIEKAFMDAAPGRPKAGK